MITIVDCGSQLTQNIARRIRESGVFSEIVPFNTSLENIIKKDVEGIIISGGQFSVYDDNSPHIPKGILDMKKPILGICYGQQEIANFLGGKVTSTENREYGETKVVLEKDSPLFNGIPKKEFSVWMSHGDVVEVAPEGFEVTARSASGHIASMKKENIYSVQFHPEVDHTEYGRKILNNFIEICNASKVWNPEKDYERIIEETKEKIFERIGVGGISGGVDSTTVSALVKKIAGDNFHPFFVDNGLLRLNEAEEVLESLNKIKVDVHYINSGERFLSKLKGVVDPDEKRKIIGNEFIYVFEEEAHKIAPDASYLVQGTLYPDVIESVPIYGSSSKIKRHHNVGGLPEKMGLEVIEPFRNLFKDEVRKIAENKLGLPKEIVWRHPFPGPGLAIRIVGQEVTEEKLDLLKKADYIFMDELKKNNLYYEISQAFAGILSQSIGVMGDEGVYQYEIGLRAVITDDFMTSDIYRFDWDILQKISNRITNEVKGVSGVNYKITQKPPGTIEWE